MRVKTLVHLYIMSNDMNSKKRKLKYIREKNYYRSGGESLCSFKVSSELLEDADFFESLLAKEAEHISCNLEKRFKMPFHLTYSDTGSVADDYMKDLITVRLTLKAVR